MSLGSRHSMAEMGRVLRKANPARGWRRYAIGGVLPVIGVLGTVATVSATPTSAPASAHGSAHGSALSKPGQSVPLSPALVGFRQGMVAVSDGSIHYVIGGNGPVLVLLHGWPMTWWEWHRVMPSLASTHTVVAFDLPGLGASTVPTSGGYTAVDTARRIHEAVKALGFGHISILAHDLGVLAAYAYARLYPHSVTRLAMLESPLNGFGIESLYNRVFHFLLNMAPSPVPEGIVNNRASERTYLGYEFGFANKPLSTHDKDVFYAAYASAANREAGYNYYRAFPQNEAYNTKHNTSKLTIPLMDMGGQDSFGPFLGPIFKQVDTDVRTIVAPNSGHFIPQEDPGFLATCANLFFSTAKNPQAPPGFEACLP